MLRVALVQAEIAPDLAAGLDKTRTLARDATRQGAQLVAFPETWLPGYPAWLDSCRDVAIWGHPAVQTGDANGVRAVETPIGRVGGLVCWEHWMPLARQALHDSGEDVHVAAWPTVHEMHQVASRHYAFEGRCYVLAGGSLMRTSALPPD